MNFIDSCITSLHSYQIMHYMIFTNINSIKNSIYDYYKEASNKERRHRIPSGNREGRRKER